MIKKISALQNCLVPIFGFLLLQFSSSAFAFTLIVAPELTPSNAITDSTTLNTQIQPVANVIKAHLNGTRRMQKTGKIAQHDNMLAANSHTGSVSDLDHAMFAYNDLASAGGSSGGGGDTNSLWINSSFSSLKNTFSRTRFDGDIQMIMAGYDHTVSDRYTLGVALGYQTSNLVTRFNTGDERTKGFNISPYFAYMLSDTWSIDLSLGHGKFNTAQSRTIGTGAFTSMTVNNDFSSTRSFMATNLTNVSAVGDWNLTGSIGIFAAKLKQDGFVDSLTGTVPGSNKSIKQWNLAGEAAYSHRDSESYVGVVYEKVKDPEAVQLSPGEQPSNDPSSFLLSAGWRHFGKDLTANFAFSSRLGQDNVTDNSFSTTIRIDL